MRADERLPTNDRAFRASQQVHSLVARLLDLASLRIDLTPWDEVDTVGYLNASLCPGRPTAPGVRAKRRRAGCTNFRPASPAASRSLPTWRSSPAPAAD